MAATVAYPVLPGNAYGLASDQRAVGAPNRAPSQVEGSVEASMPPTQQDSIEARPPADERPAVTAFPAEAVSQATASLNSTQTLGQAAAAKYSNANATWGDGSAVDVNANRNDVQPEYADNSSFAPNANGGDMRLDDGGGAAADEDEANRQTVLAAGAMNSLAHGRTELPREIRLKWTTCYPVVRLWWSGQTDDAHEQRIDGANDWIRARNMAMNRPPNTHRIPKEEWRAEIQAAIDKLGQIRSGSLSPPQRSDAVVKLVGSLTTWMHKLTRMGVDWKLLIPTNVKNEIMDLVRNEPRAKEMYDELVTAFCKPTPEQLDQLKPNEAMLDALFEHSNPVEAREMALSKLAANNGELAKLNQELGLKVSDHAFPEDLGRRLIEALKQQDAATANQLAGQIKAVVMLQGDPAHECIRADLPDVAMEAARASHMPNLIASVEDSRTTALAGSVSPLFVPMSAGSPMDIDSPRDGDKTEVVSNGVPSANRTAADGPEDKNGIPVGALKGPGFVFDDGCWKEILGYRPVGRGYQLHIGTEAPSVCKLVKASLYGKATVTDYEKAMRSKGSKPTIVEETACDLKKMSWDSLFGEGAGILTLTCVQREARARRPYVNKPVTYLHIRTQDGSEVICCRSRLGRRFTQKKVDEKIRAFRASELLLQPAMAPEKSGGAHRGSDPRSKARGRVGEDLEASLESLQRDLDKKYEDKLKSVTTAFQEELGRLEAEMLRRMHMMQNGVGLGIST